MTTTFSELFGEKVYPKLTNGCYPMILTGIGTPVETKNALGEAVQYLPLRLEVVETGRPVVFNMFADNFKSFFISPIQSQIDPDNQKEWTSISDFIHELIQDKTVLNVWVERVTYISKDGEKSTTNYTFFEPTKKTNLTSSQENAPQVQEAALSEINF